MHIAVLGVSHRTAPVELRERLAFREEALPAALTAIRRDCGILESAILSTCNRVELYTVFADLDGHAARLKDFLAKFHRLEHELLLGDRFYWHLQPDSIRHLFRVSAGLESMVLGESEILGQVREAYFKAVACDSVGPVFHRLFQFALRTGKEVRAQTKIGQGAVSVSSVAVELARRIFRNLKTKTVLTVGAGTMGEATLQCLKDRGVRSILVVNRSVESAAPLAQAVGAQAMGLNRLEDLLICSDIVISSTSSPNFILSAPQVQRAMTCRRGRPLFFIDISVPRNLDPMIGRLENVYLYDIDDLEGIASANRQMRLNEVAACTRIIEGQLQGFMGRFKRGRVDLAPWAGEAG